MRSTVGSSPPVAPGRLALIYAGLAVGAFAVLMVEVLSAFDALESWTVALCWAGALGVVLAVAVHRRPWSATVLGRVRAAWLATARIDRIGWGLLSGLLFSELVVALLAEPNNFDSQTYHLPRIEHWVADRNVGFYPTAIHRQVTLPPGAEYLLLHLRLLTGGDRLYNLVQFAALLGCLAGSTRIAAQFGGGRRAQLITALLVGSTPMVALQATSTQTDLVVAAWTTCLATLVIDGVSRRAHVGDVLWLGAASGLVVVTKTTGLLAAGPLLALWGVAQLRLALRGGDRVAASLAATAGASVGIVMVAAMLAGPYITRMTLEFGGPLGSRQLRGSVMTQRHDPAAVLVNALRIGQTALDTPIAPLRSSTQAATREIADLVGVDINDPAITFAGMTFPVPAWYPDEDRVSFPISGTVALLAWGVALVRPRRVGPQRPRLVRWYSAAVGMAGLLYVTTVKWQSSGNRLLVFLLVLAVPVSGVWLETMVRRRSGEGSAAVGDRHGWRSKAAVFTLVVVASSVMAGWLSVGYGFPRRLVGAGSVLTTSPDQTRFLRRPLWLADYRWAAQRVEASGAQRVGVIESHNDWEYPWWYLLGGRRQIVSLTSVLPKHPAPAPDSVDVIVCTSPEQLCRNHVPRDWTYQRHGTVAVATPPGE